MTPILVPKTPITDENNNITRAWMAFISELVRQNNDLQKRVAALEAR